MVKDAKETHTLIILRRRPGAAKEAKGRTTGARLVFRLLLVTKLPHERRRRRRRWGRGWDDETDSNGRQKSNGATQLH